MTSPEIVEAEDIASAQSATIIKFVPRSNLRCYHAVLLASISCYEWQGAFGFRLRAEDKMKGIMTHHPTLRRRLLLLATAAIAAAAQLPAQPPPSTPLAFEVASVKPSQPEDRRIGMQFLPGGRLLVSNIPLRMIVAIAYNVPFQSSRLIGGPGWIGSERYDIEAKAEKEAIPAGTPSEARKQKMRLMLQALLAERFKLAIRRETKEMTVYAMVVAKDGPKLERAKVGENDCPEARASDGFVCHEFVGGQGRGLHGQAVDMSDLALYVENWAERPVIDRTGIQGLFHIETRPWTTLRPGPPPAAGAKGEDGSDVADLPTLFTVFANLGLKLESQKAPVEIFEITHIEKPAQN